MTNQDIVQTAFVHIEQDGNIFLVQEKGRAYGLWSLPGGHVDPGETVEEAAIREGQEESGYPLRLGEKITVVEMSGDAYLGNSDDIGKTVAVHIFRADIVGEQGKVTEDLLATAWISKEDLKSYPLRGAWVRKGL